MPSGNGSSNENGDLPSTNGHQTSQRPEMTIPIQSKSIPIQTSGSFGSIGSPSTLSSSLKRNISQGNLINTQSKEARVRVIYTGGTIGMVRNEQNGEFAI